MNAATFLAATARRRRRHDALWIASAVIGAGALSWVGLGRAASTREVAVAALVLALAAGLVAAWRRRPAWGHEAVAKLVEARRGGLDNLLVTAADAHLTTLTPAIRDEVVRQADARVGTLAPEAVVPLARPLWAIVAALAVAVAAIVMPMRQDVPASVGDDAASGAGDAALSVVVTVSSPDYLHRGPETTVDPSEVRVPAGGSVRLVARTTLNAVSAAEAGGSAVALAGGVESGTFERTWTPSHSTTLAIVATAGETRSSRLLAIVVAPDARPVVRVTAPGRDLRVPRADAPIAVVVEATDDHAVTALELRWVRISGSGESFTFGEGRVPFTDVAREGAALRGRLSWPLAPLALERGESLVYRVVARDEAPGAPPGESEPYTIDIGPAFETTSAGAAVAEEDRRYAISQQMVIVHTERAVAGQGRDGTDAWTTRTQAIAAEQRMVRAEVVFLGGGEVQDEVEEAAHGDELQEGRLENRGRAEMLRAIGEMSRAEARLTAGDARGALVFERRALTALLAAFDRRRYFLRTVPERSRIDPARRLTGDRRLATPGPRERPAGGDPLARERALLRDLAARDPDARVPPTLAARVAAMEPDTPLWPSLAARLLAAADAAARRTVVNEIGVALGLRASAGRARVSPGVTVHDALDGLLAEERRTGSRP